MASAAVNSKVMDMLLMIHLFAAPTVCKSFVLGSCFVMYISVFFLVWHSSCWEREKWLLYFCYVLAVVRQSVFCVSSSRCRVLVCDCGISWSYSLVVWLWSGDITIWRSKDPHITWWQNYRTIRHVREHEKSVFMTATMAGILDELMSTIE